MELIGESQKKNLSRHKLAECTVYKGGDFDHEPASVEQINMLVNLVCELSSLMSLKYSINFTVVYQHKTDIMTGNRMR